MFILTQDVSPVPFRCGPVFSARGIDGMVS